MMSKPTVLLTIRSQQLRRWIPFDKAFTFLHHGVSSQCMYAMRGILICLVILGHIPTEIDLYESSKLIIYNFHMHVFFMISMLHPVAQITWRSIINLAKRYLLPVLLMSFLAFILFTFVIEKNDLSSLLSVTLKYSLALLTGNAFHFNSATGLEQFWFMYALFGLTLLRMFALRFCNTPQTITVFLAVCTMLSGLLINFAPYQTPAYIGVSSYILPFSLACFILLNQLLSVHAYRKNLTAISIFIFLFLSVSWVPDHSYNLAHLRVSPPNQMLNYLIHLVYIALAFFVIIRIAQIPGMQWLFVSLGRRSLGIYLFHMFFLYPLNILVASSSLPEIGKVCVIFIIVTMISFVFARLLQRN